MRIKDVERLLASHAELVTELSHLVRLIEPAIESGTLSIPGLATLNGAQLVIGDARKVREQIGRALP